MKKYNVEFAVGIFCIAAYLVFVFSFLTTLGVINLEVKKAIFKMYNVPLEGNK